MLKLLMSLIADLHIHSKYSRACSKDLTLPNIAKACEIKGINLVSTGDFTHPLWFEHIKTELEEKTPGIYGIRNSPIHPVRDGVSNGTKFILGTELSCIYKKRDKVRRLHLCVFAPNIETVEKIIKKLESCNFNLKSDGRPILGIDAKKLLEILLEIDEKIFVVPGHVWTPWFSIFGSYSGFDSMEECFEDLSPHIFAIETGLSCYDKKTEVLTDNGWKKFANLNKEDKICTLRPGTDNIEFQKPLKLYRYKYKGKMYRLRTSRVDLLVTPNHKLFFSGCDFRKRPIFKLKEAEFLFGKSKRFKKDGIWRGAETDHFILPAVKIKHGSKYYSGKRLKKEKKLAIEVWLKFFGFWMAEGWVSGGKNGDYGIYLGNENQKLLQEMKQILEGFGYDIYISNNVLRVRNFQLFSYLKKFGHAGEKYIPQEVKILSKKLLKVFFDYYIKGDGHRYGRNGKGLSATTISIRLRNDLQEIALKMGFSAYYKLHNKKGTPIKSLPKAEEMGYKQSKDSWVIYFIRKNIHTVLPSTVKKYGHVEKWVNYSGDVYCAQIPNHIMYIRRNGIPVWCGNSDPPMNWRLSALDNLALISNSDAHSLENLGREANVFEINTPPISPPISPRAKQGGQGGVTPNAELTYHKLFEIIKSRDAKKFLFTIEFFPEEGKYHFDGHRLCGVSFEPKETKKRKGICPVCKKPLTIGVLHRVDDLADRDEPNSNGKIPCKNLVPLKQIIAAVFGVGEKSKKVGNEYQNLIKKGENEFNILLNLSAEKISKISSPQISRAISKMREGKIKLIPGFDGEYGKIEMISEEEKMPKKQQSALF